MKARSILLDILAALFFSIRAPRGLLGITRSQLYTKLQKYRLDA